MKLEPRLAVLIVAALAVVAAGFVAGRMLKADPEPGYAFDASSPAYAATLAPAGLTKGGFSGFGETAGLPGQTMLSGKVASISGQDVVIEAADGTKTSLRLTNPASVHRIEAATRDALRTGATVILRQAPGSDQVDAVLVIASP